MPTDTTTLIEEAQDLAIKQFEGKQFTTDWVTRKIPRWVRFFGHLRDRAVDVLEVGSYEGRSAVFLLSFLPKSRLTCIDMFRGPLEDRFDFNLKEFGERVEKIKGSAITHLDMMLQEQKQFHLIYLDAGKQRDHVLAMSLLAWRLLREGGILIWDDYDWGKDQAPEDRPHDAIDIFLNLHSRDMDVLWRSGQVFVKKSKPAEGAVASRAASSESAIQDVR